MNDPCECLFCRLQRLTVQWRSAHETANQKDSPSIGIECAGELEAMLDDAEDTHVYPSDRCACPWCELRRLPSRWHGSATVIDPRASAPTFSECATNLEDALSAMGSATSRVTGTRLRELDDFGLDAAEFSDIEKL